MKRQYKEIQEKYKVHNLVNENTEIIFILESPHVDELLNHAPVSGLSGKAMSKVLYNGEKNEALGIVLKREIKEEGLERGKIGIMNICSIPMQRAAYINSQVATMYGDFNADKYKDFFDILEKLRTGTRLTYRDEERNKLQAIVLDDFVAELEELKNRNILFIPCGKTAEMFVKAANIENEKWEILKDTPHPSFGNWFKNKYSDKINELKSHLNI